MDIKKDIEKIDRVDILQDIKKIINDRISQIEFDEITGVVQKGSNTYMTLRISDSLKLEVERFQDGINNNINVYLVDNNDNFIQDLTTIRLSDNQDDSIQGLTTIRLSDNQDQSSDSIEVLVWADGNNEDYTDIYNIAVRQEDL
ncbi:hypothetical protein [Finegoldia magna]|uniref:Uncharacterized protein n=1 Tax=Finegoldia magna (strain ATCC 29328 / DSM 20472 / WAL 2508) TaxID=334413 RepID=B0S492_FINM2|nr:hypothetical protein [Finegoldia magna]UEA71238.1 hypothetical protein LK415_08980 [Finegoldia magna]BAG09083.1 hypothetical protein FMG_P0034 [Finegoldia magna ATCC 29328]